MNKDEFLGFRISGDLQETIQETVKLHEGIRSVTDLATQAIIKFIADLNTADDTSPLSHPLTPDLLTAISRIKNEPVKEFLYKSASSAPYAEIPCLYNIIKRYLLQTERSKL